MRIKLFIALSLSCAMLLTGCNDKTEKVDNDINKEEVKTTTENKSELETKENATEETIIDNDQAIEIAKDYAMRMGIEVDELYQLDLSFDEYIFEVESGGEGYLICVQMNGNVSLGDYNDYDFETPEVDSTQNELSESQKQEMVNTAIRDISQWYDVYYTGTSHLAYNDRMFIDFINGKVDWLNRNGIAINGVELCSKAGIAYVGN